MQSAWNRCPQGVKETSVFVLNRVSRQMLRCIPFLTACVISVGENSGLLKTSKKKYARDKGRQSRRNFSFNL